MVGVIAGLAAASQVGAGFSGLVISAWQWICLSAAFLFALLVGVWTVTVPTGETSLLVGLKKDSC
jgi:hypothetical protein